ncbi:hypothetical protein GCM10011413_36370 [Pedobacter psychrotolerans]|uniref:Uncharacterized protein n=1 Tax=Pedobacter psychrotolerans TaxID=1843235 RepID=A0ABQ1SV83_9SPHI|nr:hypothetical protein GCM10011413_36370 [Pedobacter psychrotolerans]
MMAIDKIMTARLSITPAIAMRTINFEKVRSDLMAIRLAMKYSKFNFDNFVTAKMLKSFLKMAYIWNIIAVHR